ncbi:MAG: BlaI/MecI/CopY family transcriptional regulator [Lachnospiraceae bacterium]|nr:BlaI/MecI/CopY family transcriptional regulator [Lachnospiraceae bacterium]
MRNNFLSESELAFAKLIWEKEPIKSGELAALCNEEFGWKKSTTYTVLKNLCNAGIFQNQKSVVTSLISEEQYQEQESTQIVEERFEGSLSKFVTAFTRKKKLTKRQLEELKRIIEENE